MWLNVVFDGAEERVMVAVKRVLIYRNVLSACTQKGFSRPEPRQHVPTYLPARIVVASKLDLQVEDQ